MNSKNNPRGLSILVIASLLIFQQFASKVGNLIANSLDYGVVDEHGIFAYISVHHLYITWYRCLLRCLLS